jgi:hypothetical protein
LGCNTVCLLVGTRVTHTRKRHSYNHCCENFKAFELKTRYRFLFKRCTKMSSALILLVLQKYFNLNINFDKPVYSACYLIQFLYTCYISAEFSFLLWTPLSSAYSYIVIRCIYFPLVGKQRLIIDCTSNPFPNISCRCVRNEISHILSIFHAQCVASAGSKAYLPSPSYTSPFASDSSRSELENIGQNSIKYSRLISDKHITTSQGLGNSIFELLF